jgi:sRNA-binding protein
MLPTLRSDRFCPPHRRALDGAVMGFIATEECRHAYLQFEQLELERLRKKREKAAARPRRSRQTEKPRARRRRKKFRIQDKVKKLRLPKRKLAEFFGE